MTSCRLCGQAIRWDKGYVSEVSGKMIPLDEDPETNRPHRCDEWKAQNRKYRDCNSCGKPIFFDESQKSINGKFIPLDQQTGQPHECSEEKEEEKVEEI
jgi:predicted nucleic acid-binding Zn ribbon protein